MLRFRKEKAAYEHLLHFGVVDAGIVPCCYGWLALSRPDIEKCCALDIEDTEDPDYEVQRWYNSVVDAEGPDSPRRPQLHQKKGGRLYKTIPEVIRIIMFIFSRTHYVA